MPTVANVNDISELYYCVIIYRLDLRDLRWFLDLRDRRDRRDLRDLRPPTVFLMPLLTPSTPFCATRSMLLPIPTNPDRPLPMVSTPVCKGPVIFLLFLVMTLGMVIDLRDLRPPVDQGNLNDDLFSFFTSQTSPLKLSVVIVPASPSSFSLCLNIFSISINFV